MIDLIVVGAGVAGSFVTRLARAAGLNVVLFDSGDAGGSRAALAIVKPSWYETVLQPLVKRSLELHRSIGAVITDRASVTDWTGALPVEKEGYYAIAPRIALLPPDEVEMIEYVSSDGRLAQIGGKAIQARLGIVVTAGIGAAALEMVKAPKLTYGATLLGEAVTSSFSVHRLNPFHDLSRVDFQGVARLGSSTAQFQQRAIPTLLASINKAPLPIPQGEQFVVGVRAYAHNAPYKRSVRGAATFLYGFGKLGYGLAPALAEQIVRGYLR